MTIYHRGLVQQAAIIGHSVPIQDHRIRNVGFEVLAVEIMKNSIFWDITLCKSWNVRSLLSHSLKKISTQMKNAVYWDITPCGDTFLRIVGSQKSHMA
jgi:hypothetical protein